MPRNPPIRPISTELVPVPVKNHNGRVVTRYLRPDNPQAVAYAKHAAPVEPVGHGRHAPKPPAPVDESTGKRSVSLRKAVEQKIVEARRCQFQKDVDRLLPDSGEQRELRELMDDRGIDSRVIHEVLRDRRFTTSLTAFDKHRAGHCGCLAR